jgi:antibiotic biosynthesis monooxygenase (ABM) superfamily enzyme
MRDIKDERHADVPTHDLTTERDPHQGRHRTMLMGMIWLAVYPSVALMTYLTAPLGWPTWAQTLLTTALTVPLITYVVVPNAKSLISRADPKA